MTDLDRIVAALRSARRVRVFGAPATEDALAARGFDVRAPFPLEGMIVGEDVYLGPISADAAIAHLADRIAMRADVDALFTRMARARRRAEDALEMAERRMRAETAKLRASLEGEIARISGSTSYKVGSALVSARTPRGVRDLPRRLADAIANAGHAAPAPRRKDLAPRRAELDAALDALLARVEGRERFVFMFSGTTYLQPIRANRPIRLTRVLLELGIPVYFSYHGSIADEDRPVEHHPLLCQAPADFTEGAIERLLRARARKRIAIISYPHRMVPSFLNRLNARGWVTLYDCRDDWEEFGKVMPLPWYSPAAERHVLSNTDATFCVSSTLVEKMRSWGGVRVHLSPNAYDPAFRSADYVRSPPERAVVGYFGHLTDRWFDYPSLFEIARRRPEYLFEIVGDGAPDGLDLPPNVVLLGPKRHSEIGHLAARWRVGIIPFRVGKLADAVDPIKIYEYFALGLPVVSFRMPQIAAYPHTTTVGDTAAFVDALDRVIASPPGDRGAFERFLASNTWRHRVDQLLDAADAVLESPPFEKGFEPVDARTTPE